MDQVKLIVIDVDGTLTDGGVHLDAEGREHKHFHIHDGLGIVMGLCAGLRFAVISGRVSEAVERRMTALGITDLHLGVGNKAAKMHEIMAAQNLSALEVAYIGDDLNDLPAFGLAGVRIAVADAAPLLRARADWVTPRNGGHGAVRDAIDYILTVQDRYEDAVHAYLAHEQARLPIVSSQ